MLGMVGIFGGRWNMQGHVTGPFLDFCWVMLLLGVCVCVCVCLCVCERERKTVHVSALGINLDLMNSE